jgi:hypothetical protein
VVYRSVHNIIKYIIAIKPRCCCRCWFIWLLKSFRTFYKLWALRRLTLLIRRFLTLNRMEFCVPFWMELARYFNFYIALYFVYYILDIFFGKSRRRWIWVEFQQRSQATTFSTGILYHPRPRCKVFNAKYFQSVCWCCHRFTFKMYKI